MTSNILYPIVDGKGTRHIVLRSHRSDPDSELEHWARRPALSIYRSYRVPNKGCDFFAPPTDLGSMASRSVILLLNGQQCALEAIDSSGNPLHPSALYRGICVAIQLTEIHKREMSLGILTTTDRDTWALVRALRIAHAEDIIEARAELPPFTFIISSE
jgi:hypothetical protein